MTDVSADDLITEWQRSGDPNAFAKLFDAAIAEARAAALTEVAQMFTPKALYSGDIVIERIDRRRVGLQDAPRVDTEKNAQLAEARREAIEECIQAAEFERQVRANQLASLHDRDGDRIFYKAQEAAVSHVIESLRALLPTPRQPAKADHIAGAGNMVPAAVAEVAPVEGGVTSAQIATALEQGRIEREACDSQRPAWRAQSMPFAASPPPPSSSETALAEMKAERLEVIYALGLIDDIECGRDLVEACKSVRACEMALMDDVARMYARAEAAEASARALREALERCADAHEHDALRIAREALAASPPTSAGTSSAVTDAVERWHELNSERRMFVLGRVKLQSEAAFRLLSAFTPEVTDGR